MGGCIAIVLLAGTAAALDDQTLARLQQAYLHARRTDEPTRRFVELFLRLAGIVWIGVEWLAAAYLVRGFYLLRTWFREPADQ